MNHLLVEDFGAITLETGGMRVPMENIVFILGSARSGTSALTRVLSLCGCTLPQRVLGAANLNPKGVWEPVVALQLNRDFLSRHDALADPTFRLHEEIVVNEDEKEKFVTKIQEFLRECSGAALVIKEPTLTEVAEFWLEAADREGISAKVVIAVRHPGEVFASQAAAFNKHLPLEYFNARWLKENLLAERHSRKLPRVFVEYHNLLHDWRTEMIRVSEALNIDLKRDETAIDDFLARDLHRQRNSGPISETFGNSWVSTVYSIFSTAAQDGPVAIPSLDEIHATYRASERAFRISWDYFRASSGPRQAAPGGAVGGFPIWNSGRDFDQNAL